MHAGTCFSVKTTKLPTKLSTGCVYVFFYVLILLNLRKMREYKIYRIEIKLF
jgi:hypothetical protein